MDAIMLLVVLLLLLLLSGTQASHFHGTTMTYYPKDTYTNGSISVILRYKLNYASCGFADPWVCSGNCGNITQSLPVTNIDQNSDWCQREGITTYLLPSSSALQLVLSSSAWTDNLNKVVSWRAVTDVELRKRSDSSKPNTSPQTTVLPVLRVHSNCQRNINLLTFDPDGDVVKCRYGNDTLLECNPCTPPSVLSLSSSCMLSFSPTVNSSEGSYAVQLVMEDFPRQTITLTHTNGSQELKTPSSAISKIPIQFLLKVVPAVPSCTLGLYVPTFLYPTPKHRTQINAAVNQTVEIPVVAEATESTLMSIQFSGPYNVQNTTSGPGQYTLRWTPSELEGGQSHPICFVVQANYTSVVLHSEFRCVVVTVSAPYFLYLLKMKISTTMSLDNKESIEKLVKDELIKRGLPSHIRVHLRSNAPVKVTTAAP